MTPTYIWFQRFTNARQYRAKQCCRPEFNYDACYCLDKIDGDNTYLPQASLVAPDIIGTKPIHTTFNGFMKMVVMYR